MPPFPTPARLPSPQKGTRVKKYAYWYDNIIEWMLANPRGNLKECAAALGRTPAALYIVTNSDVFRARYEQRRKDHFENLSQGILLRTARVAEKSLELLEQRLVEQPEKITTKQILDTASATLERLGYGAAPAPQTNISVNAQPQVSVTVSQDILFDAREKMRKVQTINAAETPTARQIAPAAPEISPAIDAILDLTPNADE